MKKSELKSLIKEVLTETPSGHFGIPEELTAFVGKSVKLEKITHESLYIFIEGILKQTSKGVFHKSMFSVKGPGFYIKFSPASVATIVHTGNTRDNITITLK